MAVTVGQRASRTLTLTSDHVRTFAEITGDYNPIHFDRDFTSRTKFKELVVQGGLTTGLLHALVAMDLPGPGSVFLSQNWKFTSPVFIGDTITADAEVVSVHPTAGDAAQGAGGQADGRGRARQGGRCYTMRLTNRRGRDSCATAACRTSALLKSGLLVPGAARVRVVVLDAGIEGGLEVPRVVVKRLVGTGEATRSTGGASADT